MERMNKDRFSTVSFIKSTGHKKNLVTNKFITNKSSYILMQQVVPKVSVGNPESFSTFKL